MVDLNPLWNITLAVLIVSRVTWNCEKRPIDFQMLEILLLDKFLIGSLKGLVHTFLEGLMPRNNIPEER